ncbi:tyrosine-type recombinase/integrase [Bifidobacterium sp. M0404]|uniref:Tyrosine-type recombinase/integrase n=1 Tax=Bifidobacterium asteroides TaxID=1684 RepID=A0A556R8D9_9BIFI|nr:tyrosine-type recombinase/integrase [Bifidobacterium sp. M0404]MBI0086898.1 tyrosine-type recombinase/integrase [Bifidobacterium sp. M0404]TSJ85155.1 tyrosine-type recombinase/integrase [Bifidobacterium polysaccharolyticum]
MTIHDLRHTVASLMVKSGANVKAIQRRLGHTSAAMTLDAYADLFDDDLDSVGGGVDERVATAKCAQNRFRRLRDVL